MRNKLFLFVFLFAVLAIVDSHAFERKKYNFNSEWRLQIGDFPEAKQSQFDDSRWKAVTLPHAFNEDEAFKVSIEQLTDTVVWYRKHFRLWMRNWNQHWRNLKQNRQDLTWQLQNLTGFVYLVHKNRWLIFCLHMRVHICSGTSRYHWQGLKACLIHRRRSPMGSLNDAYKSSFVLRSKMSAMHAMLNSLHSMCLLQEQRIFLLM